VLGILINATLIGVRVWTGEGGQRALWIAGLVVLAITVLFVAVRPTNVTAEALASAEE